MIRFMQALVIDGYGPPERARVTEIDAPKVKDGFLCVRIRAAAVNPFDYKIITGMVKDMVHIAFPYVPGMDGAGEVADVGSGVQGWQKGDAVLGQFIHGGTFAQFALISATAKGLARKPASLDFEHAAAIPEAGLTARTMIRAANIRAGQTALLIGASGGIGSFLTQLAKFEGVRIIATGKGNDAEYLRLLGADEVIDYSAGDTIAQVRERYPDGVDVVFDVINNGDALLRDAEMLHRPGTLVSSLYGPAQEAFPSGVTVHYIQLTAKDGDLADLARLAAEGKLRVEIGHAYDLAEGAQALADLVDPSKHTRGKSIIRIP